MRRDGLAPAPHMPADEKGRYTGGRLQLGSPGPNSQAKDFCRGCQENLWNVRWSAVVFRR